LALSALHLGQPQNSVSWLSRAWSMWTGPVASTSPQDFTSKDPGQPASPLVGAEAQSTCMDLQAGVCATRSGGLLAQSGESDRLSCCSSRGRPESRAWLKSQLQHPSAKSPGLEGLQFSI
jgi:hypothetical protein